MPLFMDNIDLPKTDTPESDEAAWFDNDEGWWVSRSVSRRLERNWKSAELALAESKAGAAALREALERLLRYQGDVEVLGEYEALEINAGARKKIRAKKDEIESQCHLALYDTTTAGASLIARIAELEALVAGLEQDRERLISVLESISNAILTPPHELKAMAREAIAAEIERRKA